MPITKTCGNCGKDFKVNRAREETAKFCSKSCYDAAPRERVYCTVDGCEQRAQSGGLCGTHHRRKKLYGDPLSLKYCSPGEPMKWMRDLLDKGEWGDDCIEWPFSKDNAGYAQVRHNGTTRKANLVICEEVHGHREGKGTHVKAAYTCGNGGGGCVNPRHIEWTSHKVVQVMRADRGTGNQGERNAAHKLLEVDIPDIRWATISMSDSEVAGNYGVTRKTIARIRRGEGWKHVE